MMNAQGLSMLLWSFARLDLKPPPGWTSSALGRLAPQLQDRDTAPQAAANALWALGRLNYRPRGDLQVSTRVPCPWL